jgi:hypothetical protein
MSNVIFQYDKEAALTSGASSFITEGGPHAGAITEAKYVFGKNGKKSAGLEFTLSTDHGEAKYLSVWYQKADGTTNQYGYALVQSMMGLCKLSTLTQQAKGDYSIAPEFTGKPIGLLLQKILTSKQDGSDSYKMEIKAAYLPGTKQTLKEALSKEPAVVIDQWAASLTVKDERKKGQQQATGYHQYDEVPNYPSTDDDDDAPF